MRRFPLARPSLVTIAQAAADLGVPMGSLRTAAEQHGYLIHMGRAVRIDPSCYKELIHKCRVKPQEQGSINAPTPAFSTSATLASGTDQQALEAAMRLKRLSRPTLSPRGQ